MKKTLLVATIIAGMFTATSVHAPLRSMYIYPKMKLSFSVESPLERIAKGRENFENKIRGYQREYELRKRDAIYAMIFPFYESMNIPDYITMDSVRSVIRIESTDYYKAVGKAGERGLGQLTKEAWYKVMKENFERNAFIPQKNIEATIKYLLYIDDFCKENNANWQNLTDKEKRELIIASYNAGISKMMSKNWDINKVSDSTKYHLKKFDNAYNYFSNS